MVLRISSMLVEEGILEMLLRKSELCGSRIKVVVATRKVLSKNKPFTSPRENMSSKAKSVLRLETYVL